VAEHLENSREDILASFAIPREIWRQVWADNPAEQILQAIAA
jgi:transposase-like protein